MRYWLDTEFIEDGKTIDLISIGIVAEDGRELYCEVADVDWSKASPWVLENVKPHLRHLAPKFANNLMWSLDGGIGGLMAREVIAEQVRAFCNPELHGKPEFWGYYADYDWVVLCQLFGTMMELPKGWPMYCRDIKQLCDDLGNPKLPEQGKGEHHALADAKWNKTAWDFLVESAENDRLALETARDIIRVLTKNGTMLRSMVLATGMSEELLDQALKENAGE